MAANVEFLSAPDRRHATRCRHRSIRADFGSADERAGAGMNVKCVTAIMVALSWGASAPSTAQANIYRCSGWADGPDGSRLNASISLERAQRAWVDWTPPHAGTGPMLLRLRYSIHDGRLAELRRVWTDGELASDALDANGTGYIVVKPDVRSIWREPLQIDRQGLFNMDTKTTTPFATMVLSSDYPGEGLVHPERLKTLEKIGSLEIIAFREGKPFSDNTYELSGRAIRDQLFPLAYERAADALRNGCRSVNLSCECIG